MERKPSYYAVIPSTVRYDKDLSASEKLLYGEITALANKQGYSFATNSYFAELYKTTERTITRWISKLENKNYIKREMLYGNNKEFLERRLYIVNNLSIDTDKNVYTPPEKNVYTPPEKNVGHNNTSMNNTSINSNVRQPHDTNNPYLEQCKEVIDYLNELKESKYKLSNSSTKHLKARLKDGYTVEDIKKVIKHKVDEWIDDGKMKKYIRPTTLFSKENFENYLYEVEEKAKEEENKRKPKGILKVVDSITGEEIEIPQW